MKKLILALALLLAAPLALRAQISGAGQVSCNGAAVTGTAWNSGTASNTTQVLATNVLGATVQITLDQTTTITGGAITFLGDPGDGNYVNLASWQIIDPTSGPFTTIGNPYTLVASTNKQFVVLMGGMHNLEIKLSTVISGTGSVTPFTTVVCYLLNPAVNLTQSASVTLAAPTAYGTAPSGNVLGVNADVTNIVQVSATTSVNSATNPLFFRPTDATNAMGAMANFGTSPGAVTALNANVSLFAGTTAIGQTSGALNVNVSSGSVAVTQATASNLNATVVGTLTTNNAAPAATNVGALVALANSSAPSLTNGDQALLSEDLSGNLRVSLTGTNAVSGTVTANQGGAPWSVVGTLTNNNAAPGANNLGALVALVNTSAPSFTNGDLALLSEDTSGNLRVSITGTNTISGTVTANQGGTWTVQPGNTANTTPWLVTLSGSNSNVGVTQQTSPWVDNLTQVASTALGATAVVNFGSTPAASAVPAVNANIFSAGAAITAAAPLATQLSQGGAVLSATNGLFTNILQGNAVLSTANPVFTSISDGTTKVAVVAATAALKEDVSSVAGTATVTGGVNGLLGVAGNVSSGSADAGYPVKVGCVYNANFVNNTGVPEDPLSLASGQRADCQMDAFGRILVESPTTNTLLNQLLTSAAGVKGFNLLGSFNRRVTSTADALDVNIKYPPVAAAPSASSSNAVASFRNANLTSTVVVKYIGGNLYSWSVYNPNSAVCFVDLFNTASPTLGTTVPVFTISVPGTAAANVAPGTFAFANFTSAISAAAVTVSGGATTCTTGLTVDFGIY